MNFMQVCKKITEETGVSPDLSNSDDYVNRARFKFKELELSFINGSISYGFEIGIFDKNMDWFRGFYPEDHFDSVLGHLSAEEVVEYAKRCENYKSEEKE